MSPDSSRKPSGSSAHSATNSPTASPNNPHSSRRITPTTSSNMLSVGAPSGIMGINQGWQVWRGSPSSTRNPSVSSATSGNDLSSSQGDITYRGNLHEGWTASRPASGSCPTTMTATDSQPNGTQTADGTSVDASHDEHQYLNLIRRVMDTGEVRADRTGTGTMSIFAPPNLRFSLANSTLPLLTTKKTFMRGIVEELLWFIHGSTDSTLLSKKGVKIWDGNGSKAFLESRGLHHRREGDLGPVYGFQWRHFGAEYVDRDKDYTGEGVDQLQECIRKIKENPTDRRIILSA